MKSDKALNYQLFQSAIWTVMSRWSIKAIGLVNTIILARLLNPEDFGLVAMASLVVGLLYSFGELGVQSYLIREKNVSVDLCNTAWTLQIIQYSILSLTLILIAPFAVDYFNEPRVEFIIYCLAFSSFFEGFSNIGVVFFLKDLDFKKDFTFGIVKRLLVFFVTICAALVLRSYWALVIGQIIGAILGVIVSYFIHSYRPRLSLVKYLDLLRFSASIIPMNIGSYFNNKVDVILVGGIGNTTQLGLYNMSSDLSSIFTKELIIPIGRGLFPNFSKLKDDPDKLSSAFLTAFRTIVLISLPVGFGLFSVAEDFVLVVLGEKWVSILPFIKWLIFYSLADCITNFINGRILVVVGKERLAAILVWFRVLFVTCSTLILAVPLGIEWIAPILTLSNVVLLPLGLIVLSKSINQSFNTLLSIFYPSLLSSLLMMNAIDSYLFVLLDIDAVRLILKITFGILIYMSSTYVIWLLMKKPDGFEKTVFDYLGRKRLF